MAAGIGGDILAPYMVSRRVTFFTIFSMLLLVSSAEFQNVLIFRALLAHRLELLPLCSTVSLGVAPTYLRSFCPLVSSVSAEPSVQYPTHCLVVITRMRSAAAQSRSIAYVGPLVWNCLPQSLLLELLSCSPL